MDEAIKTILKLAFGFLSDKLRTYGAEKLQDGDLTDQKFRGIIVRELDDIKVKLDCLSRKDLSTSISWLKQAVQRLHMSVGETCESVSSAYTSELPKNGTQSRDTTGAGESSIQRKPTQQSVTVENALALASAIGKLKIESNELFGLAKQSFNEAGKKACEAFHNASLSIEERILASKVRIASGILEHVDHLEVAASDCLLYLQELHDMPAIQEIFLVHVKGGIKSIFGKESRTEIVQTVIMMNLFLADYISTYTKRKMAVLDWPLIISGKQIFHPIHYDKTSLPNLKEIKVTLPWDIVILENDEIVHGAFYGHGSDFNKKMDLVCFTNGTYGPQKLDKTTGKLQPCCTFPLQDSTQPTEPSPRDRSHITFGLTVDEDDTVYVMSHIENMDGYTLSVYSADGRITDQSNLKFLKRLKCVRISVTKDKNIVIFCQSYDNIADIRVYICKSNGELINSFRPDLKNDSRILSVFSLCNNEIMLATMAHTTAQTLKALAARAAAGVVAGTAAAVVISLSVDNVVSSFFYMNVILHIYTEDGQLKKTVTCCKVVFLLLGSIINIFYNQATKNIICVEYHKDSAVVDYLSSETGKILNSYLLHETNLPEDKYTSCGCHTNGALALVGMKHVLFLQTPSM